MLIPEKRDWVVPAELVRDLVMERGVLLATATSSAPLALRGEGSDLVCFDSPLFNDRFRAEIGRFADRYAATTRSV